MPLRSVKMNRFIFGFQRRVWCPKWTPLASSCFMLTTAIVQPFCMRAAPPGTALLGCRGHRVATALASRGATPPATARVGPRWDRGGDCPAVRREGERAKSTRRRRIARPPYLLSRDALPGRSAVPRPGGGGGGGGLPRKGGGGAPPPAPRRPLPRAGPGAGRRRAGRPGRAVDLAAGGEASRDAPVLAARRSVRARAPGGRPPPGPGGGRAGRGRRRRRVRRHRRPPAGGERRPPGGLGAEVRAGGPVGGRRSAGGPGLADRHPAGRARGLSGRGVPALGAAPGQDLPRPAGPAALGARAVAALGRPTVVAVPSDPTAVPRVSPRRRRPPAAPGGPRGRSPGPAG